MSALELNHSEGKKKAPRRRVFTLAEAERALPLVRRITTDIVNEYQKLARTLALRQEQIQRGQHSAADASEQRARASADRLNELIDELHAVGCELKDWETGLVDFYAERDGELVYLCWRLGEEHIAFWHALHAGVAGRQPITDDFDAPASDGSAPPAARRHSRATSAPLG